MSESEDFMDSFSLSIPVKMVPLPKKLKIKKKKGTTPKVTPYFPVPTTSTTVDFLPPAKR